MRYKMVAIVPGYALDLNSSMNPSPLALKQLNALYISAPVLPDAPVLPEHLFLPVSARMSALVICGVI